MAAIPVGPDRADPEPGGTRAGAAVNAIGVTTTRRRPCRHSSHTHLTRAWGVGGYDPELVWCHTNGVGDGGFKGGMKGPLCVPTN